MSGTVVNLREPQPVEENIEPPDALSQTLMSKFDKCPRSAYLYKRLSGGTSSHALDRGIAFHAAMQQATETMIDQGEPTMPGEMGTDIADAVMSERQDLVLSTAEQDAVRLMMHNWAEATALDLEAIIGVEIALELQINGWTFRGRIDRAEVVDSILYLRDAKTSLNIRRREDIQRGFQGQAYALLALDGVRVVDPEDRSRDINLGAGIKEIWFFEEYPRYRTEEGPLVAKEGVWDRTEITEFRRSLERNIAAFETSLETGIWPARDGSWCSECPAQKLCPIPKELRSLDEITTEEEAQEAFSRKLAHEREGRSLQSALRGWVAENGAIYQGDLAFDATKTESRVIDWDAVNNDGVHVSEATTKRVSTKYAKRKQTEEERDGAR
jgi:hypothetical protein